MPLANRPAPPRPSTLWPPAPWLSWAWRGLFVRGHVSNQFFLFCLVGASGVVVNAAVMWLAYHGAGINYVAASVLAYIAASVNNFALNKRFTFQDKVRGKGRVTAQYLKFVSITLPGLAINEGVLIGLVQLAALDPFWANLIGVLAATVANFLGNKFFAFRPQSRSGA